jgi:hypothetical protein
MGGSTGLIALQVACSSAPLPVVTNNDDAGGSGAALSVHDAGADAARGVETTSARDAGHGRDGGGADATREVGRADATPVADAGRIDAPKDARASTDAASPDVVQPFEFDAGTCVPAVVTDGIFHPYELPAHGTLVGPDISAWFCNVDAWVTSGLYDGVYINLSTNGDTQIAIENPAGGFFGVIDGVLQVGATPGVYQGSLDGGCGQLTMIYDEPLPPGLDCDAGTPPQCPAGCASGEIGPGMPGMPPMWGPCEAVPVTAQYQVASPGKCESAPIAGSWTVDIQSIVPFSGDGGIFTADSYTAHGTVTVQMVRTGFDGGTEAATLSLTF